MYRFVLAASLGLNVGLGLLLWRAALPVDISPTDVRDAFQAGEKMGIQVSLCALIRRTQGADAWQQCHTEMARTFEGMDLCTVLK